MTSTKPIEKVPYKEITDPVSIKCDCGPESFTFLVDKTDVKMANKLIGLTGIVMEYLFRKHIDIVAIECFGILSNFIGLCWEVEENNPYIEDQELDEIEEEFSSDDEDLMNGGPQDDEL